MPKLETWRNLPDAVGAHLVQRMRERNVSIDDLNRVRIWIESKPEVPVGLWFKDFGSFKLCSEGRYPQGIRLGISPVLASIAQIEQFK